MIEEKKRHRNERVRKKIVLDMGEMEEADNKEDGWDK